MPNQILRPRPRTCAKPNPASAEHATAPTVETIAMKAELKKYLPSGIVSVATEKFAVVPCRGISFGGNVRISLGDLNAPDTIQTNGSTKNTAAMHIGT